MEANTKAFFVIFSVLLVFHFSFACANIEELNCDHSFGDPKWEYSHTFFNDTLFLKVGTKKLEIYLPKKDGEMISFICVRVPSLPASSTKAAFLSIFSKLTVTTREPVLHDTAVHVLAKKHGY